MWIQKHLFKLAGLFSTDQCRMDTAVPPSWVIEQILSIAKSSDSLLAQRL
jgi:hypothetical protein